MSERFILLTGCSGGGKSTLLAALADRGFATVTEPGRRIVSEELAGGGQALPWVDMHAFAERAVEMARQDLDHAQTLPGLVFFDRGVIDAALALAQSGGPSMTATLGGTQHYRADVFVVPPCEAQFCQDAERRHSFAAAVEEYHRLNAALARFGYTKVDLPRMSVEDRADFVLRACGAIA